MARGQSSGLKPLATLPCLAAASTCFFTTLSFNYKIHLWKDYQTMKEWKLGIDGFIMQYMLAGPEEAPFAQQQRHPAS